ncbi:Kinesin-like protein kif27 [Gonapodya sp. JEL0774]|nr:Kinesin-like protein kif27 [Gonapodya sp. JEL0774]
MAESTKLGAGHPPGAPSIVRSAATEQMPGGSGRSGERLASLEDGTNNSDISSSTSSFVELPLIDGILFWLTEALNRLVVDPLAGSIQPIPIDHWFLGVWTQLILIVHINNMIVIPMSIAWPCAFMRGYGLVVYGGDILLAVDLAIDFLKEYRNEFGFIVRSQPLIRHRFLNDEAGWLKIVARCPVDMIPFAIVLNAEIECIPYSEVSWIHLNRLDLNERGEPATFAEQYLHSIYSSLRAIFFVYREKVEAVPEKIYTLFETLFAAVVYGSLFGNLASIIRYLDSSEAANEAVEKHNYHVTKIRRYLQEKQFPAELQKKILDHEHFKFVHTRGADEAALFKELPRVLQVEIYTHLYLGLIQGLPLFRDTALTFQQSITLALRPMIALPGWYVFREGDEAAEMYFVKMGLVEVTSKDGSKVFVQLGEGKFFGEIALLENTKRTASVRAASLTELCVLTKADFEEIVNVHPGIREKMGKVVEERKEADRKRKEAAAAQAAAASKY